jgi:hypothetical protein
MSLSNANIIDEQLVMELMVSDKPVSKKAKPLTAKEKRTKRNILSFLMMASREGILEESKWMELMNYLPLEKTVKEQKEFFSDILFDENRIEEEVLKPFLASKKAEKKAEKKGKKEMKEKKVRVKKEITERKETKEKKVRVKKVKEPLPEVVEVPEPELVVEVPVVVNKKEKGKKKEKKEVSIKVSEPVVVVSEPVVVNKKENGKKEKKVKEEGKEKKVKEEGKEKKRGRKAKETILECKQDEGTSDEVDSEDQMRELLNGILQSKEPEEINVSDLENILEELEEGEEEEEDRKGRSTPILSK